MSGLDFDTDQKQTDHHQQKQELYQCRHHHSGHHQQLQKREDQSSTDHMDVEQQRFHAELKGRLNGQVNSNLHSQVSQVTFDHAEDQAASASDLELKSTRPEDFHERLELTQQTTLVRAKLLGEISGATTLDTIRNSYMKISRSPDRVCRICNKKFSSGRALGGHMRVHGPLFTQGSANRIQGVFHLAANCTQKQEEDNNERENEQEETTSIMDASEDESDKELAQHARYEQASGGDHDAKLSSKDNYDEDEFSVHGQEGGLVSLTCNTEVAGDGEEATGSAISADKKGLLYELRRNPKRTRWFAEQDFTLEAQQAFMDFSTGNSVSAEGVRACSECGKAFWSERALFGHMRCHPEREWRGALPPESSLEQRAGAMARYRRKRALEALKVMENSKAEIKTDTEGAEDRAAELEAGSAENSLRMKEAAARKARDMEDVDGREPKVPQSKVHDRELHECISIGDISEINDATPRWRSAGRRSRRGLINKAGNEETSSEEPGLTSESISLELAPEPEYKTPDFLMLLAEAARKIEEGTKSRKHPSQPGRDEYAYKFSLTSGFEGHLADKIHSLSDAGEYDDDAAEYEDENLPPFAKRERLHKDLVIINSITGKYECATCKKSFSTHQALGGHRASHKKTKGCFARTSPSELSGEPLLAEELELSTYVREIKDPSHSSHKKKKKQQRFSQQSVFKGHACSICHRIFLTGQALGGHKRCHWAGEKPSETASVASTEKTPSLHSDEQSSKIVEGGIFDLNMPAPMDGDDEAGYGSAELRSIDGESVCEVEAERRDAGMWNEFSEAKDTSRWAWSVKDLLTGGTNSALVHSTTMEMEARRRFDGIWGQRWPNKNGVSHHAQLSQPVCAVQSLV